MTFSRIFAAALAIFLILPAQASGKKDQASSVVFHLETDPGENPKMVFPHFVAGEERTFRRIPEIGTKDIASFNPFPSKDGEGFGVVFRVKSGAKNRLAAVSSSNSGRWLIARINGRIVDAVFIDKQITDGELVVWKGVSLTEVNALDKKYPRFNAKKPRG